MIKDADRIIHSFLTDAVKIYVPHKKGKFEKVSVGVGFFGQIKCELIIAEIRKDNTDKRIVRIVKETYRETTNEIIQEVAEDEDKYGVSNIFTDPRTKKEKDEMIDSLTYDLMKVRRNRGRQKASCRQSTATDYLQKGKEILKNFLKEKRIQIDSDCKIIKEQLERFRLRDKNKYEDMSSVPAQKEFYAVNCLMFLIEDIERIGKPMPESGHRIERDEWGTPVDVADRMQEAIDKAIQVEDEVYGYIG